MTFEVYYLFCICELCRDTVVPRYVGYTTVGLDRRLKRHMKDVENVDLHTRKINWIRKHGVENIRTSLIQRCESVEEMKAVEIHWIAEYRRQGFDLKNGTNGGDGTVGMIFTEDQRKKWSEVQMKRFQSEEARAAQSTAMKKRFEDPAQRKAVSDAQHILWTDEAREKHSQTLKNSCSSDEARDRLRKAALLARDGLMSKTTAEQRRKNSQKANHTQHHVNKNVVKLDCEFCT